MNDITTRFDSIMARVDEWSEENEVCDCRADAVESLMFLLNHPEYSTMSDSELFEETCGAWLEAE